MSEVIHIAYSVSRKHGGNVHVRAYVARGTWKHTQAICNGDTLALVEAEALQKIRGYYQREGQAAPVEIVNHGKKSALILDHWLF